MNTPPENGPEALSDLAADIHDLDGHTLDELADYLDGGRIPVDESIEQSAACQHALAAMVKLRTIALQMLDHPDDDRDDDDSWISTVMDRIAIDAHAGRDIHLVASPPTRIVVTEGAVKALLRAAGDNLPDLLVGRIDLDGDLDTAGATITISMKVTILHGAVISPILRTLRQQAGTAIRQHTRFVDPILNITVDDIHLRARGGRR